MQPNMFTRNVAFVMMTRREGIGGMVGGGRRFAKGTRNSETILNSALRST